MLFLYTVDHGACHIGREEVRSKLYTAVFCIDDLCEGLDGKSFGKTGHTLKKYMSVGQEGDEQGVYEMFLTYDSLVHSLCDQTDKVALACNEVVELSYINRFAHNTRCNSYGVFELYIIFICNTKLYIITNKV